MFYQYSLCDPDPYWFFRFADGCPTLASCDPWVSYLTEKLIIQGNSERFLNDSWDLTVSSRSPCCGSDRSQGTQPCELLTIQPCLWVVRGHECWSLWTAGSGLCLYFSLKPLIHPSQWLLSRHWRGQKFRRVAAHTPLFSHWVLYYPY